MGESLTAYRKGYEDGQAGRPQVSPYEGLTWTMSYHNGWRDGANRKESRIGKPLAINLRQGEPRL